MSTDVLKRIDPSIVDINQGNVVIVSPNGGNKKTIVAQIPDILSSGEFDERVNILNAKFNDITYYSA